MQQKTNQGSPTQSKAESKIVTPFHLAKLSKTGGACAQEPLPTSIHKFQWI